MDIIGQITAFAGSEPPDGWLICDGQPVDALIYPELYAMLSWNNGCTPDLKCGVPVGSGSNGEESASLGTEFKIVLLRDGNYYNIGGFGVNYIIRAASPAPPVPDIGGTVL